MSPKVSFKGWELCNLTNLACYKNNGADYFFDMESIFTVHKCLLGTKMHYPLIDSESDAITRFIYYSNYNFLLNCISALNMYVQTKI